MRTLSLPLVALLVVEADAESRVLIQNFCGRPLELYDNHVLVPLNPYQPITRWIGPKFSGMWRIGASPQANLAEFGSNAFGAVSYDISIIPTGHGIGPGYCSSLEDCKQRTGGTGFNIPMQIKPSITQGQACMTVTCLEDGCIEAYMYPKDDIKTHTCPPNTDFEVNLCPNGFGASDNQYEHVLEKKVSIMAPPTTSPPETTTSPPTTAPPTVSPTTFSPHPTTTPEVNARSLNSTSGSVQAEVLDVLVNTAKSDLDVNNAVATAAATTTTTSQPPATTPNSSPQSLTANTKSKGANTGHVGIIVVAAFAFATMAALISVVAIKRRKRDLEANDHKESSFVAPVSTPCAFDRDCDRHEFAL